MAIRRKSVDGFLAATINRHHSKTSGVANKQKLFAERRRCCYNSCIHNVANKVAPIIATMAFFNSAVGSLQTIVIALGAGLGIWGVINLLEGYGNDNPGAKSQGMKQLMAGG